MAETAIFISGRALIEVKFSTDEVSMRPSGAFAGGKIAQGS